MAQIRTAAAIGGGVIGGGWIARLVLNGIDVNVYDPDPDAERKTGEMLSNAERAYARLTLAPSPPKGRIVFCETLAEAVREVDLVQESAPERLALKQALFEEIDTHARADALIGSSTSGLLPTDLQARMRAPQRMFVAHPFNPVYLLPLVELVGGAQTSTDTIERARAGYSALGMKPLHVRKEIDAFVADRLLEAVWREALWLVNDEVATVEEIDDVIRYSFGLRWAQMGLFMTYRIAGGEAGMRHFIEQFGPTLKWPWTKLMDVPALDEQLIEKIAGQSDDQASGRSVRELERIRDDNLVAIMQALKGWNSGQGWGAGATLKDYEAGLYARTHAEAREAEFDLSRPLRLVQTRVAPEWVDYNGHMTESRYLQVFGDSTDALLQRVGVDGDYVATGRSYYTVETHIMHLAEVQALEPIHSTTQLISADEKRLHVFHRIYHSGTDTVLASAEQMLLHVDAKASKATPADPLVLSRVKQIADAHAGLPMPEAKGRYVGAKR